MALYNYRIAVGHSVALGSLVNVETALANVSDLRPSGRVPRSLPVDLFPLRTVSAGGREIGDGRIDHQWVFDYFTRNALEYMIDTYLTVSSARVVNRAVTIYTPIDTDEYARFNCYICLPKPGQDYARNMPGYSPVTIRFTKLIYQAEP